MRLIDADKHIEYLNAKRDVCLRFDDVLGDQIYQVAIDEIKGADTIDFDSVEYQPMSKDFARIITKGIAGLLSELQLDLPSIIYEDIESNLLKGKLADVECFIKNYIENNGAKMDEEQE